MRGETRNVRLLYTDVVCHCYLHRVVVRTRLEQDEIVLFKAGIHDCGRSVERAEGRLGAYLAVGEELFELVLVDELNVLGV
jgi:hypothetical protein